MVFQLEETRMQDSMRRIEGQTIRLRTIIHPSPFCFPIMVDRLREKLSFEKLEDKIKRMKLKLT
jgi:ATP-dependent Lhr-like helicase